MLTPPPADMFTPPLVLFFELEHCSAHSMNSCQCKSTRESDGAVLSLRALRSTAFWLVLMAPRNVGPLKVSTQESERERGVVW